jgi:hypothetical protein
VANAIQYAQRDKKRKKKRKLNSYELAARKERKAENATLMAMMDEVGIGQTVNCLSHHSSYLPFSKNKKKARKTSISIRATFWKYIIFARMDVEETKDGCGTYGDCGRPKEQTKERPTGCPDFVRWTAVYTYYSFRTIRRTT